jgi:hypothetical protein
LELKLENLKDTVDSELFLKELIEFLVSMQSQKLAPSKLTSGLITQLVSMPAAPEKNFYVVKSGDKVCGSICSFMPVGKDFGCFGFYEIDLKQGHSDKVSALLLDAAFSDSKNQSKSKMLGPIEYNIWLSYRTKTKGFDKNFSWEPSHPEEYYKLLDKHGLSKSHMFYTEFVEVAKSSYSRHEKSYEASLESGFKFKRFSEVDLFGRYLQDLYRLSIGSFADSSELYEPLSFEAFMALYVPIFKSSDLDNGWLCFDQNEQLVGFLYAFMDENDGKKHGVFKTIAISDDYRGKKLSNALYYKTATELVKNGAQVIVNALIKDEGKAFSFSKGDDKTVSEYAVFAKKING